MARKRRSDSARDSSQWRLDSASQASVCNDMSSSASPKSSFALVPPWCKRVQRWKAGGAAGLHQEWHLRRAVLDDGCGLRRRRGKKKEKKGVGRPGGGGHAGRPDSLKVLMEKEPANQVERQRRLAGLPGATQVPRESHGFQVATQRSQSYGCHDCSEEVLAALRSLQILPGKTGWLGGASVNTPSPTRLAVALLGIVLCAKPHQGGNGSDAFSPRPATHQCGRWGRTQRTFRSRETFIPCDALVSARWPTLFVFLNLCAGPAGLRRNTACGWRARAAPQSIRLLGRRPRQHGKALTR